MVDCWRNREAAFFSFLFPILLLLLIGSVYGDEPIDGIEPATFLLIGLLGYGVSATAFAALAITIVVRREAGMLKRVRGTPLGPATYLAASSRSRQVGTVGHRVSAERPCDPNTARLDRHLGAGMDFWSPSIIWSMEKLPTR